MNILKIFIVVLFSSFSLIGCGTTDEPDTAESDKDQVVTDQNNSEQEDGVTKETVSYEDIESIIKGFYLGVADVVSEDDLFFIVPTDQTLKSYLKTFWLYSGTSIEAPEGFDDEHWNEFFIKSLTITLLEVIEEMQPDKEMPDYKIFVMWPDETDKALLIIENGEVTFDINEGTEEAD